MARESETYRFELEQLISKFPNQAVISRKELSEYLGKGRTWMDAHGFVGTSFTLVKVAYTLSHLK